MGTRLIKTPLRAAKALSSWTPDSFLSPGIIPPKTAHHVCWQHCAGRRRSSHEHWRRRKVWPSGWRGHHRLYPPAVAWHPRSQCEIRGVGQPLPTFMPIHTRSAAQNCLPFPPLRLIVGYLDTFTMPMRLVPNRTLKLQVSRRLACLAFSGPARRPKTSIRLLGDATAPRSALASRAPIPHLRPASMSARRNG